MLGRPEKHCRRRLLVAAALVVGLGIVGASPTEAATRFVSPKGKDAGTCTQLLCATIKYALSKAGNGDIIDLAPGTYTEACIVVDKDVTIRGHGAAVTVVQAAAKAGVASGRVFCLGNKKKKVKIAIEKLTARYGRSSFGGGIHVGVSADVTISDSKIVNNAAVGSSGLGGSVAAGGGILVNQMASLKIVDSTIANNTAASEKGLPTGGGIFAYCFSTLTIENSTISGNTAKYHGGGIATGAPSTLTIKDSTINNNNVGAGGGGISSGDKATISNTTVANNGASYGGGIQNDGAMVIVDSKITSNGAGRGGGISNAGVLTVRKSTLSGNGAYHGGGIEQLGATGNSVTIVNSTLSGNSANWGGAMRVGGPATITSSTLAGNATNAVHEDAAGISSSGTITIKNSIVAHNLSGGLNPGKNCYGKGTIKALGVNLDTDKSCPGFTHVTTSQLKLGPLLVNLPGSTATMALAAGSAAIDAASDCKDAKGNKLTTDQRGVKRPQPSKGKCDVGAYERNGLVTISGDLNSDGKVNVIDARIAQQIAGQFGKYTKAGDWNGDGEVDSLDVMAIASTGIGLITGPYTLTVTKGGAGGGQVTSTPLGIVCGAACAIGFAGGTKVVLIATPDKFSAISGWKGCDSATDDECIVDMNGHRTVKAEFVIKASISGR